MREMKDSGIEWIRDIPKEWTVSRIKYIADIFGRIGFRGYTKEDFVDEGEGAISLSPSNINGMDMSYEKCSYISWKKYYESPEIMVKEGDVIFVKTGSSFGKSSFISKLPMESTINPQLIVFKNIKIDSNMFAYYIATKYIRAMSDLVVVGGTIPTMSQEKIKNFPVLIPPNASQSLIAKFLNDFSLNIDSISEDIQKEISLLEEYKKSVITEAVTKGLNPDAEMKDSGIEYIGITPIHWNKYRLKYILLERNIRTTTGEEMLLSVSQYKGVVPSKDINNRTMQANSLIGYKIVKKDDLVFNKLNPGLARFGNSEFDGITSPDFSVYIVDDKKCTAKFLQHLLKTYKYVAKIKGDCTGVGDGFARLYSEQLYRFVVSLPPIEELHSIVAYIDSKSSEIDALIADKKRQLDILADYKKSLIYEYVTGKKEVPVNE